jgi:hypothetical protein
MTENRKMVALILGQSNFANHGDTKASCDSGTFALDGLKLVPAADPIPGATGKMGSIWTRFGPICLQSGIWEQIILVNVAVGGSLIKSWAPSGENHDRLIDAVRRCRELDLQITHVFFHQGESDTAYDTCGDEYEADLQEVVNGLRGQEVEAPITVCLVSYYRGQKSEQVRQAQRNVVEQNLDMVLGPDSDLVIDGYRYDNLHFNEFGLEKMAELLFETIKVKTA